MLVLGEDELGSNMRRVLQAAGQKPPESKPALELNVAHPLVKYLDGVSDKDQFAELAQLLYDQAALAEGGQLSESHGVRAAAESRADSPRPAPFRHERATGGRRPARLAWIARRPDRQHRAHSSGRLEPARQMLCPPRQLPLQESHS